MRLMISRSILAVGFVLAGTLHFVFPAIYLKIVPPYLNPHFDFIIAKRAVSVPMLLIWISGAAEIAGGIGLLIPQTRDAAAWGLVALLVAVFPANFYMAQAHLPSPGITGQAWAQWARLPLQAVLIWWVLSCRRG
jgi:uncharacterized membrane protein